MKATIHFLDGRVTEYPSEDLALFVWFLTPEHDRVAFRREGDARPVGEVADEGNEPF